MASGLTPSLPLTFGDAANYNLIQTYEKLIRQNLKNLILTVPGERVMDTSFGVGLRSFLFEHNDSSTYSEISARIHNQVKKYMSFIDIVDINFTTDVRNENSVYITVDYIIIPLSLADTLSILAAT